ncbi:tyrosine-type recombinase/integrase [Cereibacter azotoformans]|uniref:tyrosine-type recombinase/integrase n=1 Tax=Cereibacter azotoformans TaxID=43057 RepID=UPI003B21FB58
MTTKRLASGEVRRYYYHRATGAPLPPPDEPGHVAAWAQQETLAPVEVGNVNELIRNYLTSLTFEKKAIRTQREYKRMLTEVEKKFGKLPVKALGSPKVRGVFLEYQEEIGRDRPREADNRLTILSAVFRHAKLRGKIESNPLEGFERLYHGDRSEIIWTESDIRRFMNGAAIELQRALILAIHTGQRYGDLIRLRWADYDGESISLKQSKTKARVNVHCSEALRLMLDATPRQGPYILTRVDGRPWFTEGSDKELSKQWRTHMQAAGFYQRPFDELTKAEKASHLHFNDLRGTAVTMLAAAGVSVPQICAVTGHTLQSATRILEKYLARTSAMSKAAILAFENSPATAFANRLQTGADPLGEGKKNA